MLKSADSGQESADSSADSNADSNADAARVGVWVRVFRLEGIHIMNVSGHRFCS